jgi:hypothetical protein
MSQQILVFHTHPSDQVSIMRVLAKFPCLFVGLLRECMEYTEY